MIIDDKMMRDEFQKLLKEQNKPIDRVMIGTKVVHKMAIHAWAEGGLVLLDLGNGYGLEIVHDGKDYPTIQLWHYAINCVPKQQTWVKQKTIYQKALPKPELKQPKAKKETQIKFEHKSDVLEI